MDSNQQISQPMQPAIPLSQPPKKDSIISGKTLLLILILGACAIFFLVLALNPQSPIQKQMVTKQIPIPTPFAQSTLALLPAPAATTPATPGVYQYNVALSSAANVVNAVQLELSYDPKTVTNVKIVAGPFFPNPLDLIKDIDPINGRISYALGIQPQAHGIKGDGIVATLSFQILPTTTVSSTTIVFLPKTLVTAEGNIQSVLKSSTNATVSLPHQ